MLPKLIMKRNVNSHIWKIIKRTFVKLTWPETGLEGEEGFQPNATIIDGQEISNKIKRLLSEEIKYLQTSHQALICDRPKLGYIVVGDRPDSHLYVKMKRKSCDAVGIDTVGRMFPESVSQEEIKDYIIDLNNDPTVSGILMQLPLPGKSLDETALYDTIAHEKDVDGIHPLNMAAMARYEDPFYTPCTPKGIMWLIRSVWPVIKGKKATVIGRSNIVGMPIALLLQKEFATVTLWHSYTTDLVSEITNADIVVSATGWPHLVKGDYIKKGAIVIDVGTQFIKDDSRKSGKRLVGDIEYDSVSKTAGYITPVPGGVGPMTIAMLMDNIVLAWKRANFQHISETIKRMEEAKQSAYLSNMLTDVNYHFTQN